MISNKRVMLVFGTRPEAIKLAPIIMELKKRSSEVGEVIVCVTGQHREMLDQMLRLFSIKADHDLDIMTKNQTLEGITEKILAGIDPVISERKPDVILVQGDTTTALVGALAGFYKKIPVGHVEAGLRTDNKYNPYPEEMNRRLVSQIADYHFAPTERAKKNLVAESVRESQIHVTGNTVIDSLLMIAQSELSPSQEELKDIDDKTILITTHRRENLGEGMDGIFKAISRLANEYPDYKFVFPVHLNPVVQEHARRSLSSVSNVILLPPLVYEDLVFVMKKAYLVMTDSGGIQEEAPSLGKPVLVLRTTTERPEGVEAGTAKLIGVEEESVYEAAKQLLNDKAEYQKMAQSVNPYGDGKAAKYIVDALLK